MAAAVAILDFAIDQKIFHMIVPLEGLLVCSCRFWLKSDERVHLPSQIVIFQRKFCRNSIFDRRRPSWILRKMKNNSTGLFLRSTSMSIPYFFLNQNNEIKMTSRNVICGVKFCRFWTFDLKLPSWIKAIWKKNQKLFRRIVFRVKDHFHACFVQIGWTGSNCQGKMWFPSPSPSLCDKALHRALMWAMSGQGDFFFKLFYFEI